MIKVDYLRHCGDDLSVVDAARVSFDKASDWDYQCVMCGETPHECGCPARTFRPALNEEDKKLLAFLGRHKHKSPFNHTFITFRVSAPIFIARQLVKHEYMPWNEVSRRYVEGDLEWYCPEPDDWRFQPDNVKQGSGEPLSAFAVGALEVSYKRLLNHAEELYNFAIKNGLCREQARMFLPQSLMTQWHWSGTLFAFMKMVNLRLDNHAQRECHYVAEPILNKLKELYPVSTDALLKYGTE